MFAKRPGASNTALAFSLTKAWRGVAGVRNAPAISLYGAIRNTTRDVAIYRRSDAPGPSRPGHGRVAGMLVAPADRPPMARNTTGAVAIIGRPGRPGFGEPAWGSRQFPASRKHRMGVAGMPWLAVSRPPYPARSGPSRSVHHAPRLHVPRAPGASRPSSRRRLRENGRDGF
jgi:hypothetical protein